MKFKAGQTVRLKDDPTSIGTITGQTKERSGSIYYKINFNNNTGYQPERSIEMFNEQEDWEELLEKGKFGRPSNLRQHLTHIYLNGKLANLVYSMEATNTDFYAYQFKPVLSFLESPSNGLLIADEVGLGKTIEAGLIWTELKARENAKNLLIVCPAMLTEKWCAEFRSKFGEEASIVNASELLNQTKKFAEVGRPKVMVCSIQGLRPPKDWKDEKNQSKRAELARFLDQKSTEEPILDMLIIDEAHYLRNRETQSNMAARLLTNVSKNNVLLTATPINIHSQDLFQLLHLIDRDNFDDLDVFPKIIDANEPLTKARTLALNHSASAEDILRELNAAKENELFFNNRQLDNLSNTDINSFLDSNSQRVRLADKISKINLLRHTYTRTRKKEVQDQFQVIRQPKAEFIDLDIDGAEYDFYRRTTAAIKDYAKEADIPGGFLLTMPQRYISSCMVAAAEYWKDPITEPALVEFDEYDALGEDSVNEQIVDRMPMIDYLKREVIPYVDVDDLERNDSKYNRLIEVLKKIFSDNREEKIIIFSYFRNTLHYLQRRLSDENITSQILMGGMREDKQSIIDRFREDSSINVLLSSEVASEGVDLQFCRMLINYDLPWNPMKVEQRIGRIDRLGQKHDIVTIWNLFHKDTVDERIYTKLLDRLKIFERALGGVNDVVGPEIKELTRELIFGDLTEEQEIDKINQAAIALENKKLQEEQLEKEASSLVAHGGYILDQVQAAFDFNRRITDTDLFLYVKNYLNAFVQGHRLELLDKKGGIYSLTLTPDLITKMSEYINSEKLSGLTRIGYDVSSQIRFENKTGFSTNQIKVEVINQFHPLIRFISYDLTVRLNENNTFFLPLVSASLNADKVKSLGLDEGVYFFALNKWFFKGLQTKEELKARVIREGDDDFIGSSVSWDIINTLRLHGKDWLDVDYELDQKTLVTKDIIDDCITRLDEDFEQTKSDNQIENLDRIQFQKNSVERQNKRRLKSLNQTLENFKSKDPEHRMIAPTQGKINAQTQRTEVRLQELCGQERMVSSREEICVGVFKVIA